MLKSLLRSLHILRVIFRYRLDTLCADLSLPWLLRWPLNLLRVLPKPQLNRGVRLRLALEQLGPVFIKFGQVLSTRPDLIPADVARELNKLQDDVPPFASKDFVDLVEAELDGRIEDLFASFESEPLASASVAQVHAATLDDGREVVVKAIRPGIQKTIELDCNLLISLAHLLEKYSVESRRLRPIEIATDYRTTILDELDLKREAANTAILRRNFESSPLLYIPEIYWPYTTQRVMVMERIYATPVTDTEALRTANTDFKVLAERGVEIFFTQVFDHNFFHADMHPGNIFVDTTHPAQPRYMAVDCAVVGTLSSADMYYLARNFLAIFRRDYRQVAELHILSGWAPKDTPVNELESAVRTVCEPIFQRPLKDISLAHLLINLFQVARRFDTEIQPSLVLLQKTLLNIEGMGRQLYPDLNLWDTAHPFLEKWLKQRFKPARMLDQFKRHGPEWLEQLPQVPQLMFQGLERISHMDQSLKALADARSASSVISLKTALIFSMGVALGVAAGGALLLLGLN